jgi:hypothetical protein
LPVSGPGGECRKAHGGLELLGRFEVSVGLLGAAEEGVDLPETAVSRAFDAGSERDDEELAPVGFDEGKQLAGALTVA